MALGDIYEATAGDSTDLYYVDVGLYDVPEYGTVYILDADQPAIVETGNGYHYEVVLDALEEVGIAPEDVAVIAPTHVHLDHAGGAGVLAEHCPNAEVYIPERGARHLVDPERLWEGTKQAVGARIDYYREPTPVDEDRLVELADGDVVDLGDHALEVHDAPGHAPHQAVYYDPANDGVFAADAAGIHVPSAPDQVFPTTAPPTFDLEGCLADVEMLQSLAPSAIYYGHFGAAPADGLLEQYSEVLPEWVATVEAASEQYDDVEAMTEHILADSPQADVWSERQAWDKVLMDVKGIVHYLDHRDEA